MDPTGRGKDVKWKKIKTQQQKVMKKTQQKFFFQKGVLPEKSGGLFRGF
jgi:hypothetical protein